MIFPLEIFWRPKQRPFPFCYIAPKWTARKKLYMKLIIWFHSFSHWTILFCLLSYNYFDWLCSVWFSMEMAKKKCKSIMISPKNHVYIIFPWLFLTFSFVYLIYWTSNMIQIFFCIHISTLLDFMNGRQGKQWQKNNPMIV